MDTTKFLITLPTELKERLKEHAIEKGLNLNAYIRMILTEQSQQKAIKEMINAQKKETHKDTLTKNKFMGFSKDKQIGR